MSDTTDKRWDWLRGTWRCATCNQSHQGLFDVGFAAPAQWEGPTKPLPNPALYGGSRDCLTEDFCVIDAQQYFVRCMLELPLIGAGGQRFGFGVWARLAEKDFGNYLDTFDDDQQGRLGPWPGWFANRLVPYPDTLNLKCRVRPRDRCQRPWIDIEPTSPHPLAKDSRKGISYDRLLEIYAVWDHVPAPNVLH